MIDADGVKDQKKINNVSGNVVAVLQAGAFFGALSSAPVSCEYPIHLFLHFFRSPIHVPRNLEYSRPTPPCSYVMLLSMVPLRSEEEKLV